MRVLVLGLTLCLAAGPAMAQSGGLGPSPRAPAVESSPLSHMEKEGRAWIKAEIARQKTGMGSAGMLELDVEENLGQELLIISARERVGPQELIKAVMFKIMTQASEELETEIRNLTRKLRKSPDPAVQSQIAEVAARKDAVDQLRMEVMARQSIESRAIAQYMQ